MFFCFQCDDVTLVQKKTCCQSIIPDPWRLDSQLDHMEKNLSEIGINTQNVKI